MFGLRDKTAGCIVNTSQRTNLSQSCYRGHEAGCARDSAIAHPEGLFRLAVGLPIYKGRYEFMTRLVKAGPYSHLLD